MSEIPLKALVQGLVQMIDDFSTVGCTQSDEDKLVDLYLTVSRFLFKRKANLRGG